MVPIACDGLPRILGLAGPEWCSLVRPAVGNVIPDLLFGRLNTADPLIPVLTHVEACVVSLVQGRAEFSPSDVLSSIFLTDLTVDKMLRALEKKGALERTPSGALRVSQNLAAIHMEIVAVELKLRRWRDACGQAAKYLPFADRAYAVLDGNQVKPTDEVCATFGGAGVGLVLQFGADFKMVVNSTAQRTMSSDRLIAAQKLVKAALY